MEIQHLSTDRKLFVVVHKYIICRGLRSLLLLELGYSIATQESYENHTTYWPHNNAELFLYIFERNLRSRLLHN